jgi:hypothetical protein
MRKMMTTNMICNKKIHIYIVYLKCETNKTVHRRPIPVVVDFESGTSY